MTNNTWKKFVSSLRFTLVMAFIAAAISSIAPGQALAGKQNLMDQVKNFSDSLQPESLSSKEIVGGLKEALRVGSKKSLDILGKPDGFFKDDSVKIPMPESLQKVDKLLRSLGQKKLADKFIKTMNRAAEKSVQSAFDIFVGAIQHMSIKDAVKIFKGAEDEATRYFRRIKGQELYDTIHPIVKDATDKTGVTATYKKITKTVLKLQPSLAKNMPDINKYVTGKTMDGIFLKLAKEEAAIRKDPATRTTEILKKVFK